jgi:hypothetical protein
LNPPLVLSANFLFVKLNGNLYVTEELDIISIDIIIRGIATVRFESFPLPLPVPFTVQAQMIFDTPMTLLDFPLKIGKIWGTSPCTIKIDVTMQTFFGLIKIPFQHEMELGAMDGICTDLESVSVTAGTFEAYKISFFDMITIHYAPGVNNIIRLEGAYEDMISVYGELKETNYE